MSLESDTVCFLRKHIAFLKQDKHNLLQAYKYSRDSLGIFVETTSFSWSPKVKVKVELLSAGTVLECLTGRDIIVCVVKVNNKQTKGDSYYILQVNVDTDRFIALRKLPTSFSSGQDFILCDGPNLVAYTKRELYFYESQVDGLMHELVHECEHSNKIKCVLHTYFNKPQRLSYIFYLLNKDDQMHELACIKCRDEAICDVNVSSFIPVELLGCVSAVTVLRLEEDDHHVLESSVLIGTNEGYVFHIKDGMLQRSFRCFDTAVNSIKCTGSLFLVSSSSCHIVIDKKFQVIELVYTYNNLKYFACKTVVTK